MSTTETVASPTAIAPTDDLVDCRPEDIVYETYKSEEELAELTALCDKELSEPYSVFTYRFFTNYWPKLTIVARHNGRAVGVVMCKVEPDERRREAGYIGMLVVDPRYRGKRIGSTLVRLEIRAMQQAGAELIVLETECTNISALRLYEQLGFVRSEQLNSYYMNNANAYRLKLWLQHYPGIASPPEETEAVVSATEAARAEEADAAAAGGTTTEAASASATVPGKP
jgi:peptide alpha-N-acetyltransferase